MLRNLCRPFSKIFGFDKNQLLIIAGSGPAGCTAAIYAARAGLKPLVLHGPTPGGQLTTTDIISNYPGWKGTGPNLMLFLEKQAKECGAQFGYEQIENFNINNDIITLKTNMGIYNPKSLIISTGASARYLGLPSEKKFIGRGVSACAVCDGPLYSGKEVIVVGGGNSAVSEALYLQSIAKKVTLIHRGSFLRAETSLQNQLKKSSINIIYNAQISEVFGTKSVDGVKISLTDTHKQIVTNQNLKCSALFIAIGRNPATTPFKGIIKMDENGYIIAPNGKTNVKDVFAAGDCVQGSQKQAITAASAGCQAAFLAEKYLASL